MGDKTRGIYEKFKVERTDGKSAPGGKHNGCQYFVLDVTCDQHAIRALLAYAESCKGEYPLLAADVRKMAITNCEHDWAETLHGPDVVGDHCIICGTDREYDDGDDYGE
jgi:hypothetical protein